jgi:hypothetical protein
VKEEDVVDQYDVKRCGRSQITFSIGKGMVNSVLIK